MKLSNTSATSSRIIKALSVFGSVHVLSTLASIVRVKLIALMIGPVGVGIYSLFWQTIELLRNIGGMNAHTPAVREIVTLQDDKEAMALRIRHIRRLAAWLGAATMLVAMLFSPLLSRIMFGHTGYTLWFMALSPMIGLTVFSTMNSSIMQAQNRLRALALSSLWASIVSAAMAVLMIWLWGLRGVVPALLSVGIVQYLFSCWFSERKMSFSHRWSMLRLTFAENRKLLSVGGYLTVSMAFTMLCSYVFMILLNRYYDTETVGYYQAGYTILNSYAGIFFVAMSVEYYPRLSRWVNSKLRISAVVNHEIVLILRILIPLMVVFVLLAWLVVRILYSAEFEPVVPFLVYAAPGLVFKAVSVSLAYIILARGDGKTYIRTEISSSLIGLALFAVGFMKFGFIGLGIAYTLWYAAYTAITYYVYAVRYRCTLRSRVWILLAVGIVSVSLAVAIQQAVTFR